MMKNRLTIRGKDDTMECKRGFPRGPRNVSFLNAHILKRYGSRSQGLMDTDYTAKWSSIIKLALDTYMEKVNLFLLRYALQIMTHIAFRSRERNLRHHGERPL